VPVATASTSPSTGQAEETNTLAVAALVSSILGVTLVPILGGIVGLILGYAARNQLTEGPGRNRSIVRASIILGWIGVFLIFVYLLLIMFLWGLWSVSY